MPAGHGSTIASAKRPRSASRTAPVSCVASKRGAIASPSGALPSAAGSASAAASNGITATLNGSGPPATPEVAVQPTGASSPAQTSRARHFIGRPPRRWIR